MMNREQFEADLLAYFKETQPDRVLTLAAIAEWRGESGEYAERPVVRGMWEGWKRALLSASKPAAPSADTQDERGAFEELRNQMNYIAAYDPDESDRMSKDRLADRLRAIIERARRAMRGFNAASTSANVAAAAPQPSQPVEAGEPVATQKHIAWLHFCLRDTGYCIDGGKCHHSCKTKGACWRKDEGSCVPLSGSALDDEWRLPTATESAVVLDDERAQTPLAWQSTFDGLLAYVLQDNLHNRLTPRVIDIAYTAFMSGASGKNKDNGGPCDWFNDTKPVVQNAIAKLSKPLSEARATSPQATATQPAAPEFDAKHVSLKEGANGKLLLTLLLDGVEGAPRYKVTPVNPGVVRAAAHTASGGAA